MSKIKGLGVELEGGWNEIPPAYKNIGRHSVDRDGSVDCRGTYVGEIQLGVYTSVKKLLHDVGENYPKNTDTSCGIHVHMSLDSYSYQKLMEKSFHTCFLKNMKEWGLEKGINENSAFWKRLAGSNRYCKKTFSPTAQAKLTYKESVRYSQLNYCYSLHGTLECRLLPAFQKKELAISGIAKIIDIVEKYLSITKDEEIAIDMIDTGEEELVVTTKRRKI